MGLGLLFGNGAAAYLSRLLGRGDKETADRLASTALYSSVMPYALTYTSIYITFSIFNVFNVSMNNIVSSEGAAKTAMCALMAGAVLNVVLDPFCIYGFDLGVAGAAIATAVSQFVSSLVYLCYIFSKKSIFHFHIKECCYTKEIMSEILKIGIPTVVFQLLTSLFLVMGKAKEGCILGGCRQGICFVPVILVLPRIMGLNGKRV